MLRSKKPGRKELGSGGGGNGCRQEPHPEQLQGKCCFPPSKEEPSPEKKKKSKTSPELAKSPALSTTTCFSDGKNPCSDCPYSGLASQHLLHSLTPNSSFSPCPQTKAPVHEGQPCIDVVNGQV